MTQHITAIAMLAAALSGCASNWIGVDGQAVDHNTVAVATTACQVEQKSQMLKDTRSYTERAKAGSQANAERIERAYDAFAQKVNADIAQCMRERGLVAS